MFLGLCLVNHNMLTKHCAMIHPTKVLAPRQCLKAITWTSTVVWDILFWPKLWVRIQTLHKQNQWNSFQKYTANTIQSEQSPVARQAIRSVIRKYEDRAYHQSIPPVEQSVCSTMLWVGTITKTPQQRVSMKQSRTTSAECCKHK